MLSKEPPVGYSSLPVDLIHGLETIRENAAQNKYSNQFDFDLEINALITRANDAHLSLGLCSQGLMHFEHRVALASISENSLEIPMIYTYCKLNEGLKLFMNLSPIFKLISKNL